MDPVAVERSSRRNWVYCKSISETIALRSAMELIWWSILRLFIFMTLFSDFSGRFCVFFSQENYILRRRWKVLSFFLSKSFEVSDFNFFISSTVCKIKFSYFFWLHDTEALKTQPENRSDISELSINSLLKVWLKAAFYVRERTTKLLIEK